MEGELERKERAGLLRRALASLPDDTRVVLVEQFVRGMLKLLARPALLQPLRYGPFRLLFAGRAISDLGDWLDLLALLALIAYQWRLGAPR